MQQYDFLVIGSGPAGQQAALQAASLCKRVALIEKNFSVGGVCLHTGTIPSKTLRAAVLYLTGWDQRGLYGQGYRLKANLTIDDLMDRLKITIQHEVEVIRTQLARRGVEVLQGTASFIDPHQVAILGDGGQTTMVRGEKILIASGTTPAHPANIPFDDISVIDSDGILRLKKMPRSMVVVGGGVVGIEYASIFSALDCQVTLIDGRPTLLNFMDREIVDELVHHLRKRGVVVRLGENVRQVEPMGYGQVNTTLESGKQMRSDIVLFAAGRVGATAPLHLEEIGIHPDARRLLKVNDHFQTELPHIYAAGDIIGFPSLASTSMEQGRMAACHAFGVPVHPQHTAYIPYGIYAIPEMSVVGKTEQELTEQKIPYEVGIARLHETARGQIMGIKEGILKILFELHSHKVLGVHILGEQSAELIHIGQAVLALGGTIDYFLESVFNYPTLAEAYKMAAWDAWSRLAPDQCPVAVSDSGQEEEWRD